MRKVLITGVTGFLGSQIAESLIRTGTHVIGLKRPSSDLWRCKDFQNDVEWVDHQERYQSVLIEKKPDTIIHSAWIGVEAKDRDNWGMQSQNVNFLIDLLEIAKKAEVKKVIFLGSQAEYGIINGDAREDSIPIANTAYGSIKLA